MAIILLLYFVGVLVFAVIGLVGVFHAIKYKMPGDSATKGAYIFLGVSLVIFVVSLVFIFRADWSKMPDFLSGENKKTISSEVK